MNAFSFSKQVRLVHQVKHSIIKINSDSFSNWLHIQKFWSRKQGQQGQLVPLGQKVGNISIVDDFIWLYL